MATFTLDDILATTERQYQSYDLNLGPAGVLVLRNPLRMSAEERAKLSSLFDNSEDADEASLLEGVVTLAATDKALAEKFIERHDLAVLATVVKGYTETVNPGEA